MLFRFTTTLALVAEICSFLLREIWGPIHSSAQSRPPPTTPMLRRSFTRPAVRASRSIFRVCMAAVRTLLPAHQYPVWRTVPKDRGSWKLIEATAFFGIFLMGNAG